MITTSTNYLGSVPPAPSDPRRGRAVGGESLAASQADNLTATRTAELRTALAATPEIRTEVVERASSLAVDPNYPPREIIEQVARLIVASQDASNLPE